MIALQFLAGDSCSSKAIELLGAGGTRRSLSHVDAILPNGKLLGARSDLVGGMPRGVWERPADYVRQAGARRRVIMELPATADQARRFYAFLDDQISKPYDWLAIVAFGFNRDWRAPGRWFCSELQGAALEHAGILRHLYTPQNKVQPTLLATVCSEAGARWQELKAA